MSSAPATFKFQKDEAFEALVNSEPIFESDARFLVFCACLGYNRKRRTHDYEKNGEMRWSYINQDSILAVMTASLAYAATDDPEAMMDPETQIEVLAQCSAGGSQLIKNRVLDEPGENLDLLVELLQEERNRGEFSERVDILSEIEDEVSSI